MAHSDRDRIFSPPEGRSCIDSIFDAKLKGPTRSELSSLPLSFRKWGCDMTPVYTMFWPLRLLEGEDSVIIEESSRASFRNIFLKRTKHYANHSCSQSFGLKQGKQSLVDRRRAFQAPLRIRRCVIRTPLTLTTESFYYKIHYKISVKIHIRLKCSITKKIQKGVEW